MPRKRDPEKCCSACGKPLARTRMNGRLEDRSVFLRRKYCNLRCAGRGHRKARVKRATLHKRASRFRADKCERCGATDVLSLHHIDRNPKNNRRSNRMTLCGSCHTRWHWEHGKTMPKHDRSCEVCGMPARKSRWCQKHYQRFRKHGDPCLTKKRHGRSWRLVRDPG